MPTQWAHSFYWAVSSTVVEPERPAGPGGYPAWQSAVTVGSGFGVIGAWASARWAQLKWWWRLKTRIDRLSPDRRHALWRTFDALESPVFPLACQAVAETAHTRHFNRPEEWLVYSRALKADPGRAENVFRHVRAMELTSAARRQQGSTVSHQTLNLVVELAYQSYAAQPWEPV